MISGRMDTPPTTEHQYFGPHTIYRSGRPDAVGEFKEWGPFEVVTRRGPGDYAKNHFATYAEALAFIKSYDDGQA